MTQNNQAPFEKGDIVYLEKHYKHQTEAEDYSLLDRITPNEELIVKSISDIEGVFGNANREWSIILEGHSYHHPTIKFKKVVINEYKCDPKPLGAITLRIVKDITPKSFPTMGDLFNKTIKKGSETWISVEKWNFVLRGETPYAYIENNRHYANIPKEYVEEVIVAKERKSAFFKLPYEYCVNCENSTQLDEVVKWFSSKTKFQPIKSTYENWTIDKLSLYRTIDIDDLDHSSRLNRYGISSNGYPIIQFVEWKQLINKNKSEDNLYDFEVVDCDTKLKWNYIRDNFIKRRGGYSQNEMPFVKDAGIAPAESSWASLDYWKGKESKIYSFEAWMRKHIDYNFRVGDKVIFKPEIAKIMGGFTKTWNREFILTIDKINEQTLFFNKSQLGKGYEGIGYFSNHILCFVKLTKEEFEKRRNEDIHDTKLSKPFPKKESKNIDLINKKNNKHTIRGNKQS